MVSSTNSLGFTESSTTDDATGQVATATDKNGIVTLYTYDKFGNPVEATTPISKALKTTGWSAGMTDAPANSLYFTWNKVTGAAYTIEFYDCLGRSLRKITETVGGKKVYIDQAYNKKGELVKTSEPYFADDQQYWTLNEYDDASRIITRTNPDGNSYKFQYAGLTTVTTDPLGHTDTKTNDLNGLLVSSMDNAGTSITYKYNADGKCVETKGPRTTIRCTYDIAGNRTSLDDPDLGSSQDTYNAFGELISHHDGHGDTQYKYDVGGRVVLETRPDFTISTTYDNGWKGAIDEVTSVDNIIKSSFSYTYDKYGRTIKKHTLIDDREYEVAYTYNSANHIETITYPNGLRIKNDYDDCGIQTSVSNANSQKVYWKLSKLNARGQIEKEEYGNGLITSTGYDAAKGTISSIFTKGIQNWRYAFDAVGNLVSREDLYKNLSEYFIYDGLNRLVTVSKSGQTSLSVTYDAAGNITSKSDVGTYNYEDGSNKLVSITNCKRRIAIWDDIVYNSFDKIINLRFSDKTMMLEYGPTSHEFFLLSKVLSGNTMSIICLSKKCAGEKNTTSTIFLHLARLLLLLQRVKILISSTYSTTI